MPITPQHIDSTAIDTANVKAVPVYYVPTYSHGFPDSDSVNASPMTQIDHLPIMEVPEGKVPHEYIDTPFKSGGTLLLIIFAFLFFAFSYRKGFKYFSTMSHNLFSVKKRHNMFDDHTVNETQILIALITNTCILEGILLYFVISVYNVDINLSANPFLNVLVCIGVAGLYYFLQLIAFYVLGYIFDDNHGTQLWIKGYNATQSILGLLLVPVTLIILLYPNTLSEMLFCALILYLSMRIVFICKGFRIFFNNLSSTVYFILYLCSVEIVPVILSYAGAVILCRLIHS
ncbi:MAG: DUF4271 domain-containing protein [Muribaculaceae bacterium]